MNPVDLVKSLMGASAWDWERERRAARSQGERCSTECGGSGGMIEIEEKAPSFCFLALLGRWLRVAAVHCHRGKPKSNVGSFGMMAHSQPVLLAHPINK